MSRVFGFSQGLRFCNNDLKDSKEQSYISAQQVKANHHAGDFPGGAMVKNPLANAGDMGSIPGPGRSHMPQSN